MGQGKPEYFIISTPDPDEKPYPEWSYRKRRAYLAKKADQLGGIKLINQTEEADRFDISITQIHKDLHNFVYPYLASKINPDEVKSDYYTTYKKRLEAQLEDGEYMEANETAKGAVFTLMKLGEIEKEPEKIDIQGMDIVFKERDDEDE